MNEKREKMTENPAGKSRRQEKIKMNPVLAEVLSWVEVLAAAFVIAFLCNTFIIANAKVPSSSMESTILEGDRVIGSRLSYSFGDPNYGDIAVFRFGWICNHCKVAMGEGEAPETCPYCHKEIGHPKTLYYLKRVIGLPGDVIEIKAEGSVAQSEIKTNPGLDKSRGADAQLVTAAVYRNGEKLSEDYLNEPMLYTGDMRFEIPDNCYFMLGDNRNNSMDARYWKNSYIPKEQMVAKVLFRYYRQPSLLK